MIQNLREIWRELGRSIFEGERYERSMRGITIGSLLIVAVNLITGCINYVNGFYSAAFTAPAFIVAGLFILFFTVVRRDRRGALAVSLATVVAIFTYEIFSVPHGFPIFWTLLLPLGFCYLSSVRSGIGLSLYFLVLYWVLFYTPLRATVAGQYSDIITQRFPILYLADVVLTTYIMVQYHLNTLHQMDYARELLESKKAADEASAAKSEFLANMSHEIRTPINAVLGMNEMILRECLDAREGLDPEAAARAFQSIGTCAGDLGSAGNNLLSIVNDILDFSKIEAGKMELAEGEYQLCSVLNDVSNMTLFKARDKGLDFVVDVDESLPDLLWGDELRLRQIITNLLSNAVKYTEQGSVRLIVRGMGTLSPGETLRLVLTVRDTGIGIRPEDQEKLFAKFQRVDLEHNSTVEGTGLGLVITQSLLELMGGSITLESAYGAGSTFTVMIPQRIVASEPVGDFQQRFHESIQQDRQDRRTSLRAPRARILIVDDTRMNLTVAVGLLKHTRIQMDTALSGAEALEKTLAVAYDLILMDQRMPEMDGTEALHRIRTQQGGKNRACPVICLTADAVSGARERYLSEGFTDYLTKPVDGRSLEKMLMKRLPAEKVMTDVTEETGPEVPCPNAGAALSATVGLGYCQNDEALYGSLLGEYAQSAPEKRRSLSAALAAGDWQRYGVEVHSLKSGSRMIGALPLSERAARLEAAADRGEVDAIRQEHSALLEELDAVLEAISALRPGSSGIAEERREPSVQGVLEFAPEGEVLEFPPDGEVLEFPPDGEVLEFAPEE